MPLSSDAITNIFILVSFMSCFGEIMPKTIGEGNDDSTDRRGTMKSLLSSMERAVLFYSENIDKVNLDSVYGLRVGQGGLNKAIVESKIHVGDEIFQRLVRLHAKIVEIGDRGFKKLRSADSTYFHKFEHLIDGKWFTIMPYHNVDLSMVHTIPLENYGDFDEASSDQCMTDLIGSQQSGIQKQCKVTDNCWNLMTRKGTGKYYLTHQGLFLILAENQGCRAQVLDKVENDNAWENQVKYIGANIYHQLLTTYNQKKTEDDEVGKDLFVEQIVVCQMLGVLQCFDSKFVDVILKMQDVSGCWKQDSKDEQDDAKDVISPEDVNKDEQQIVVKLHGRKLQEEVILQGGCSAHFTGVATGCLGLYTYWFASHPDTHNPRDGNISKGKDSRTNINFFNSGTSAGQFFVIKWSAVFLLITFSFYIFRKLRRNMGPVLQKYEKLSV